MFTRKPFLKINLLFLHKFTEYSFKIKERMETVFNEIKHSVKTGGPLSC